MHTNYIQMPPDSTGKKILLQRVVLFTVADSTGIKKGDIFTTDTTGNTLKCSASVIVGGVHMIHGAFTATASETATDPIVGETLSVGGVVKTTTVSPAPYYEFANLHSVVSADNPYHGQIVDARGQAYMRFAEGSPSMDAFGNLRTGEASALGTYDYAHGDSADLFQDLTATSGTVTYNALGSETSLTVTSANGSSASRTTVRYHHYQPGVSNLIIQTLAHGDAGKANNVRRWGYYDTNDGIFWELNGTTKNVVIRSSVSGSIVETRIAQSSWNVDKLDGTGISGMNLDLTKANFYFIDYAWLGVGEVRFGVLGPGGERNLCHVFQNPNANTHVYMQSGCFPLRWENINVGSTGGVSEMRLMCSAVYSQSKIDYTFWRFADIERTAPVVVTINTPVLSMRVASGSHVGVYPESLNVFVTGGNVKLTIIDDATLSGATWGITGEGIAEGDIGATSLTGGTKFKSFYVPAGVSNINLSEIYELNDEGYHRLPDNSGSYTFTLAATKLDGTTVSVGATLNYRELR